MSQVHQIVNGVGFEHLLLFLNSETENRSEKIGQPHWIIGAQHHQAHFRRHLRQVGQRLLNQRLHIALGRFDFFLVLDLQLGQHPHATAQVRL